jgi:hypothetical protein
MQSCGILKRQALNWDKKSSWSIELSIEYALYAATENWKLF